MYRHRHRHTWSDCNRTHTQVHTHRHRHTHAHTDRQTHTYTHTDIGTCTLCSKQIQIFGLWIHINLICILSQRNCVACIYRAMFLSQIKRLLFIHMSSEKHFKDRQKNNFPTVLHFYQDEKFDMLVFAVWGTLDRQVPWFMTSPWYDLRGWLGVKQQLSILVYDQQWWR